MAKVSVIIPSRNEPLLEKTVEDVFRNAMGEIEVIVILNGATQYPLPKARPNLIFIKREKGTGGFRSAINEGVKASTGKYILKADAHCAFSKGFDVELQKNCEDNWIVIPRLYTLDTVNWKPTENPRDYYYLGFPCNRTPFIMGDMPWYTKSLERKDIMIDDLMTFGGSVWFISKKHFNNLGGLHEEGYGTFAVEQQEIGLKTWLGGGRVVINKNCWYAHIWRKLSQRPYPPDDESNSGREYSARYWWENKWKDRVHDFDWLVEKFWPLPHPGKRNRWDRYIWPVNWKDYYKYGVTELCCLAIRYGSDKCAPNHSYTPRYFELFKDKRDSIKKVLEIGVGSPETMITKNYTVGASLRMWRDFFPNAQIYGIDNDPKVMFKDNRIQTFLADQGSKADLEETIKKIGSDIDFVVDDGSHFQTDQIISCLTLMPLLKKGVVYIIEDVQDLKVGDILKMCGYEITYKKFYHKRGYNDRMIEVRHK